MVKKKKETKLNEIYEPTSEELELADGELSIIALSQGETTEGQRYWAYIAIPPSKFRAFKEAEKEGGFSLFDFGAIISCGEGEEPPEEIKKRMEQEYGVAHDFEERVAEQAKELMEKSELLEKYSGKNKPETK